MAQPAEYRHKPTVIKAMQLTPGTLRDVLDWLYSEIPGEYEWDGNKGSLTIQTLEGPRDFPASVGYWVAEGIRGEWYCIAPAVFAAAYEPAGGAM